MSNYETDITAINKLYEQYCLGGNSDDLDLFISLWADDAMRLEANTPAILGKEQIHAHFKFFFDQFHQIVTIHGETEVQISGNMAFSRGDFTVSLTPKEGGPTALLNGKWMDILKRQADDSWKIYRDCVVIDAPPQAT
ncbi:MAG: SgcJ/EcaC family oxidoreductase [Gammaproteobacteria bacterium]|nr:SgcJ/EcaC family oxidoreductase [Gammaproteobacteria bacterium]